MTKRIEPYPCPFCGMEGEVKSWRCYGENGYTTKYYVTCTYSWCPGMRPFTREYTRCGRAIAAWNTRRKPPRAISMMTIDQVLAKIEDVNAE